jgi:hypothetical protein
MKAVGTALLRFRWEQRLSSSVALGVPDERRRRRSDSPQSQPPSAQARRSYATTSPQPCIGLAGVALLGVAAYVTYKRARGEDLTPSSSQQAQAAYKEFHAQRTDAGDAKRKPATLKKKDETKDDKER